MNLTKILSATVALAVIGTAAVLLIPSPTDHATEGSALDVEAMPVADVSESIFDRLIVLDETQRQAAKIETAIVQRTTMHLTRTLPGRFAYDNTRHIAVRAPADAVVESVQVQTADEVSPGQAIAVLRSPTIGAARNQILSERSTLALARERLQWESDIRDGIVRLADLIQQREAVETIKDQLAKSKLGVPGGDILARYSQMLLAEKTSRSVDRISESGAISGRVVRERSSELQQAESGLATAIDQSIFQTHQSVATAKSEVESAQRQLLVAQQTLHTLLGSFAELESDSDASPTPSDPSRLTLRSPLKGTIERKVYSASERVAAGDEMFIIADTNQLWVEADIRGRDWHSIDLSQRDHVTVSTPSVDLPPQDATVIFVGREVDPASGAIPLVVQIDNTAGQYRPGLFARVAVPTGTLESVIAVPETAVVDLDGNDAVFVTADQGFKPVIIRKGKSADSMVEVSAGIQDGQTVVVSGAFVLKSELLLEGEE
ncbi:Cobalt-zinc-cadmium resistance protein CzcB [Rubripirellula lacrimiformis]|uniref:Cobalt-zinc-cadmium resistance protein CzcB n=1 Tax=Rubripirellula lacrimiformis TaxID=1930273 RepID=A0A517NFK0_9BACT|nr:efflux RND transporter periplasmic adaptor subunit [Rubripirellula lacrimiformis]QDT05910.1 Cobalt-zinc-cadmium resistance protein CzcB [Rubripirellula lacrimiformis]